MKRTGRKSPKITVLLPAEDFKRFDSYCQDQGFKKSTLIARLIRDHLDSAGFGMQRDLPIISEPEKPPQD